MRLLMEARGFKRKAKKSTNEQRIRGTSASLTFTCSPKEQLEGTDEKTQKVREADDL